MSLLGRLVVPLGLNGRPYDPRVTPSALQASLLEPPSDDIERIERANLAWLVFCQDTYSSTSCGWQGLIDDRDLVSLFSSPSFWGRRRRDKEEDALLTLRSSVRSFPFLCSVSRATDLSQYFQRRSELVSLLSFEESCA